MIEIDDISLYRYAQSRGYEPLIDERFSLEIHLRVEIQREIFGTDHEKFYRWMWEHRPHICEETMQPLRGYSAAYVSHILTRGAHPEMAHDPRNINILCLEAHHRWEFGQRVGMRIYESNQLKIQQLKQEYSRL